MTYCSVVTVLALVGLTKKRFGHYAILKNLSFRSLSMTISKDDSHQIVSIWNRYEAGTAFIWDPRSSVWVEHNLLKLYAINRPSSRRT